jgi:hypothetical protein
MHVYIAGLASFACLQLLMERCSMRVVLLMSAVIGQGGRTTITAYLQVLFRLSLQRWRQGTHQGIMSCSRGMGGQRLLGAFGVSSKIPKRYCCLPGWLPMCNVVSLAPGVENVSGTIMSTVTLLQTMLLLQRAG